jgi:hypothetical protein
MRMENGNVFLILVIMHGNFSEATRKSAVDEAECYSNREIDGFI